MRTRQWAGPRRRLRAGVTQLLFAVAGLLAGRAVTGVTLPPAAPTTRVFDLLMAIGFAVLSITTVIFSLLFLVVQWAAGNLSPRLNLFRDDPIVWRTFAYSIGVFVFCITAALSVGRQETVSAAIPGTATVLALVTIALIRRLQLKAFASIQLAPMLAAVTGHGTAALAQTQNGTHDGTHDGTRDGPGEPGGPPGQTVIWPGPGAVLQQLRLDRLTALAHEAGAVIVLRQQVGATLLPGTPVADVHAPAPLPAEAVLATAVTGLERVFGQDSLLAFRLLADIGLRALSSAINDPATAVQALDRLHELLLAAVGRRPTGGRLTGPDGTVRVVLAAPGWEDYLATGLDDLIAARGVSPLVHRRLVAMLHDLHGRAAPAQQPALAARLALLGEAPARER